MSTDPNAHAFWDVKNSDVDVFGNVNVTATSIGDNGNLIRFECGSSSEPFFVFLLRDSSGEISEIPAKFLHVDQNGDRRETEATLGSWNENYLAVKVTDKVMLRRIAEHMIVAKNLYRLALPFLVQTIRPLTRSAHAAAPQLAAHCLSIAFLNKIVS